MKWSATTVLAGLIAVGFLLAFVAGIAKSGVGIDPPLPTKFLLNKVGTVEAALAQAKKEGKTVMIDFSADWCPPCKKMEEEAFTDQDIADLLKDTLFVSVDVDHPGANEKAVDKYKPKGLPTVVFLNADGKVIGRAIGFGGVSSFKAKITKILQKA